MSDEFDKGADDFASGPGDVLTTTPSITYINEAGVPEETVDVIKGMKEVASVIERWSRSLNEGVESATMDVFNRSRYSGSKHIFAQMGQCSAAVENDEILSTTADVMESLAFQKTRFELYDEDQQDMWNQWAGLVDLDSRIREQFRELFKVSQVYVGLWWERHIFQVRNSAIDTTLEDMKQAQSEKEEEEYQRQVEAYNKNPNKDQLNPPNPPLPPPAKGQGNRNRKKKFPVTVPTAMTIFDPTKILPVGTLMFGRERFAYIASEGEHRAFANVMQGDLVDDMVLRLIEKQYEPTESEKTVLSVMDIPHDRLWLLKADSVFRHTLTRSQYERFAPVRLKTILPILDMKQHLRASDRASLIGNTNFIVVIKKGTDKLPAKAAEIDNLREQAKVVARLPILVGDHRLSVEIVSPTLDNTLIESRWEVLDSRLVFTALQTFQPTIQGGMGSSAGVSEMSRVVARGIENRRHELVRTLEAKIFKLVLERNEGVLDEKPSLVFTPKRVTLDFNADVINAILKLRDRGDLSRETMLEEVDFDQDVEVLRRARERVDYDEVFASSVPFSSPGANPFAVSGGAGPGGAPSGQPGAGPSPKPAVPPVVSGNAGGRPRGKEETKPRKRSDS